MSKIQVVWFKDMQIWSVALQNTQKISSKFELKKLREVLIDLTKMRTFVIKDDEFYQEPTISSKTNLITPRKQGFGKEFKVKKRVLILPNDLVIAKMHTQNGLYAFAKDTFASTSTFIPFKIMEDKINKDYLFIILKMTLQRLQKFDSVNRETYTTNEILDLQIPYPPREIQDKIVSDIQNLQNQIKALQDEEKRLKDEIEAYIYIALGLQKLEQSPRQRVFTVRFKDLERWDTTHNQSKILGVNSKSIDSVSAKYPLVRLGEICEIARGGSPRPISKYITKDNMGINWIKIGDTDIGGKYITKTAQKITKEGSFKSRFVKSGSFLLTNSMSFGRPYILKIDGCIHDGWLVIRGFKNFVIEDYFYEILSSDFAKQQFAMEAVGSAVQNLTIDKVKKTKIPLPPLEIQGKIVKDIENLQEQINDRKEKIVLYESEKQALATRLLQ